MIDINVLNNNPERDKKNILVFSQKIKKTFKNLAKLASKIREVVQSGEEEGDHLTTIPTFASLIAATAPVKEISIPHRDV